MRKTALFAFLRVSGLYTRMDDSRYLSVSVSVSVSVSRFISVCRCTYVLVFFCYFFLAVQSVFSLSRTCINQRCVCVRARLCVCVCVCVYILHVRMQHSCKCGMYTKAGSDCDRDGLGARVRVWGGRARARMFGQDKQGGRQKSTVYPFRRFCLLFEGSGGSQNVHAPSL